MKVFFFIALFLYVSLASSSELPKKEILAKMSEKLEALKNEQAWQAFVTNNPKLYPPANKTTNAKTIVHVEKEDIKVNGESYTLGVGYQQTYIFAPIEKVKSVINAPDRYQFLFGLDGTSKVDFSAEEIAQQPKNQEVFKARVFKKIPILPNQEYILVYTHFQKDKIWFQRASLVEDKGDFALRDNLLVLEPSEGNTILREMSLVYIIPWAIRALGPQIRIIMKAELGKVAEATKCAAESNNYDKEVASSCWEKAKKWNNNSTENSDAI